VIAAEHGGARGRPGVELPLEKALACQQARINPWLMSA
jgi:hypothetical protein